MGEPRLIEGGLAIDDRGTLAFVNGFSFNDVRRFYIVANHRPGFVRAWHGHRREGKWVTAVDGEAIVCAVRVDDWEKPSKDAPVYRYVLSAAKPAVLQIPAGYANGFMTLTNNAKLFFFSSATLEESKNDDVRFDARYWDPWQIVER